MEKVRVLSRVEEPTDWSSGMVVVPKKKKDPRICVDLTNLNESVCEQILGSLGGAKVFSDADVGFWQIPLAEESRKLMTLTGN